MKLTDTQLIVLTNAARRSTLLALPLPANLKGGAANKVVIPLMQKGLLEEVDANVRAGETVWRETGDGHGVTLAITEAGLAAIGIRPETEPKSKAEPNPPPARRPPRRPRKPTRRPQARKRRRPRRLPRRSKRPRPRRPPAIRRARHATAPSRRP